MGCPLLSEEGGNLSGEFGDLVPEGAVGVETRRRDAASRRCRGEASVPRSAVGRRRCSGRRVVEERSRSISVRRSGSR